ncbi:MAG: phosphate/phosphite/phosphonate ABC transporter substrate-binding protein [Deltaproteobacteria bacterium]|nr:phosphate/phosphite/phosphonate ABC transporter substrate-binding protein [Deltaproteobacteria bacterium]
MLTSVLVALAVISPEPALVVTTLPFDEPQKQRAVFASLDQELSRMLGRRVQFRASATYKDSVAQLRERRADVALLGAAAYIEARKGGDVRAILRTIRHRQGNYYGVIVVKRGSPFRSLKDLKGKRFAFVDPGSTSGYVFARRLLASASIDPEQDLTISFAGGHHKVVEQVAQGTVDAGACFEGAQDTLVDPEAVTPIARTELVPGDPVVVRGGLAPQLIKELRVALIELANSPAAKPFFTYADIDGFVPAIDSDYDALAEMMRAPQ